LGTIGPGLQVAKVRDAGVCWHHVFTMYTFVGVLHVRVLLVQHSALLTTFTRTIFYR